MKKKPLSEILLDFYQQIVDLEEENADLKKDNEILEQQVDNLLDEIHELETGGNYGSPEK